jgi:hypothetical protein
VKAADEADEKGAKYIYHDFMGRRFPQMDADNQGK